MAKAHPSIPAACFYLRKIPVLCCAVWSFDVHEMSRQRSELKKKMKNDTKARMTQTSGNSIRSVVSQMVLREGKNWVADTRRSHLALAAWGERRWRGQEQQKNNEEGRSAEACLHSLISFHCLPLPWPSCLMNFPTLSSWLISLKPCCALFPDGFSCVPVLPLRQAHR